MSASTRQGQRMFIPAIGSMRKFLNPMCPLSVVTVIGEPKQRQVATPKKAQQCRSARRGSSAWWSSSQLGSCKQSLAIDANAVSKTQTRKPPGEKCFLLFLLSTPARRISRRPAKGGEWFGGSESQVGGRSRIGKGRGGRLACHGLASKNGKEGKTSGLRD